MHYFKFNIGDHAKDSQHLSNTEDLALRRLKELQYETEEPISLPMEKLARKLRMRGDEESIEIVLDEFFEETKKGWINQTIMEEVEAYHLRVDSARENGKKGGRKPKERTEPEPNPNQSVTEHQANHKPLTINQEPVTSNQEPITTNQQPVTRNESSKDTPLPPQGDLCMPESTQDDDLGAKDRQPKGKAKKPATRPAVKPEGLDDEVWEEFKAIKKLKKQRLSAISMKTLENNASEYGITLAECIEICAGKGWGTFKPEYMDNKVVTINQGGKNDTQSERDKDYWQLSSEGKDRRLQEQLETLQQSGIQDYF